jgi:hypothetical protein
MQQVPPLPDNSIHPLVVMAVSAGAAARLQLDFCEEAVVVG